MHNADPVRHENMRTMHMICTVNKHKTTAWQYDFGTSVLA